MNRSVNLLPTSCQAQHMRLRRRNGWTVVLVSAGVFLLIAWGWRWNAERRLDHANVELAMLQIKQGDFDRQLAISSWQRNELVNQARMVGGLRQGQTASERLLAFSHAAPPGIVISEIRMLRAAPPRMVNVVGNRATLPGRADTATPESTSDVEPGRSDPAWHNIRVSGYALDQDELTALVGAAEQVPGWDHVELLRVDRTPLGNGTTLAFELACRGTGATP